MISPSLDFTSSDGITFIGSSGKRDSAIAAAKCIVVGHAQRSQTPPRRSLHQLTRDLKRILAQPRVAVHVHPYSARHPFLVVQINARFHASSL